MKIKNKCWFVPFTLGLGTFLTLLWVLGYKTPVPIHAQGPDGYGTYYVAPGRGCGSVDPCFGDIQAAVNAVDAPDDVVKVSTGTYITVSAREGVTQVVYISKTVHIQGGYTTTNWLTSNFALYPTVLDAQGQGRVLYITGDISPTLEGLHITGGDAAELGGFPWSLDDFGGGVYIVDATATISHCSIFSNTASTVGQSDGGGLYLLYSNSILYGNTFFSNTASVGGGAYLHYSTATLDNNLIFANRANYGGGVYLHFGSDKLISNTITLNTVSLGGGGVRLEESAAQLDGNTIHANTAYNGGGLELSESNSILLNNIVTDNDCTHTGCGLHIYGSTPRLIHTTVAHNKGGDGSGISITGDAIADSTVILTNTILASHSVGINVTSGNTVTVNSILWYDTPITISQSITAAVTVLNQHEGDPAFVNPSTGDYHIGVGSAAIDTGIDAGVILDIDGDFRPFGDNPDLGADELAAALTISKSGPSEVKPGELVTYTLMITNSGAISASNVVITDVIPSGARYVGGGTLMLNDIVGWTIASLTPNSNIQVQFAVTTTKTITNSNYRVSCAEGMSAIGSKIVVTSIEYDNIYLPMVLRQSS